MQRKTKIGKIPTALIPLRTSQASRGVQIRMKALVGIMLQEGHPKKEFFDPKNVIFPISNFDLCRGTLGSQDYTAIGDTMLAISPYIEQLPAT